MLGRVSLTERPSDHWPVAWWSMLFCCSGCASWLDSSRSWELTDEREEMEDTESALFLLIGPVLGAPGALEAPGKFGVILLSLLSGIDFYMSCIMGIASCGVRPIDRSVDGVVSPTRRGRMQAAKV